jgi:hypothetical protein
MERIVAAWVRVLFNVLAMVAEFEGDLIQLRSREGMRVAKAMGRLRGKQLKLNVGQEAHPVALHRAGEHSVVELGDLFGVTRATVYRAIQRDAALNAPVSPVVRPRVEPRRKGIGLRDWLPPHGRGRPGRRGGRKR